MVRLLASLDVVAVSQTPSPESNPDSPLPVTTMLPLCWWNGRQLTYLNKRSALASGSHAPSFTTSADDLSTNIEEADVFIHSKLHVSYHLTNFQFGRRYEAGVMSIGIRSSGERPPRALMDLGQGDRPEGAGPATTPVIDFYAGKSIFITGGTGFLGLVLVEKLLYACERIENLYLLIRPKKGKTAGDRLAELMTSSAFQRLKTEKPRVLEKIVPIRGDVRKTAGHRPEEQDVICGMSEAESGPSTQKVVHDNARYIVAAIRDNWKSDDDIEMSVRCSCHSLQCSVETALKECHLKDCLQKVSAIVGHFKHSNKATTALENAQKKINLPIHRLISHSPTRWNSAYEMVERLVEQRDAVESVLLDKEITTTEKNEKILLNNSDWTYLEEIIKIFKPFEVASRLMSTENQSTLSMVRPTIYSLLNKFLEQQDDDTENIILIKETLEEELKNRFLSNSDVTSCGLASYLDPRYKDLANEEETYRNKIKEKLMDMTERINVNEPDSSKNQRERDLDFLFDPVRSLSGNVQRMASLEGQTAEK
ncbi:Putative fatty acyl-CoA reductase CG5065 [Eumeta japonica]|uniref:Fatty acyl-CoA reductase CG5065 n=1 Tax=Eumeta variegata TaxID=151549 RepID=A0A4C1X8Z9_EUMVA|nr:Putative fatty acyl-CoA reductase CG5065 [Eumeta japonica]